MFLLFGSVQLRGTDKLAHCSFGVASGSRACEQLPHWIAAEVNDSVAETTSRKVSIVDVSRLQL